MNKHYTYKTEGVCARELSFDLIDGHIWNIKFVGGCTGNTQGVARLADGMKAEEVIHCLSGVDCHNGVSCPNELAKAVQKCLNESEEG